MISYGNGKIEISREIAASPELIWDILTDTAMWHKWGPSVVDVDCIHQQIAKGDCGRVKTIVGFWVPFVITEYKEFSYWYWRVATVKATGHRIIRIDEKNCRVSFDMPWWAIFYLPICYLALRRIEHLCMNM